MVDGLRHELDFDADIEDRRAIGDGRGGEVELALRRFDVHVGGRFEAGHDGVGDHAAYWSRDAGGHDVLGAYEPVARVGYCGAAGVTGPRAGCGVELVVLVETGEEE